MATPNPDYIGADVDAEHLEMLTFEERDEIENATMSPRAFQDMLRAILHS